MSDKIEILKKTSQEKIAQLLKKSEEAKAQLKILDNKLKTLKDEESRIERKERVNKLIAISAMLFGENWEKVHVILTESPDKLEKIKRLINPIIEPKKSRILLYIS